MDGNGYTMGEVIWWILIAALIGFAIGWILRRWFLNREFAEERARIRTEEKEKSTRLSGELDEWRSNASSLTADLEGANGQIAAQQARIGELETALSQAEEAGGKAAAEMAERDTTIAALRSELDQNAGDLASAKEAAASAQTSLADAKQAEQALRNKLGEGEPALAAANSSTVVADLEAKLIAAEGARDRASALLSEAEARHAGCADRAEADADRIAALEAQLSQQPLVELPDKDVAVAKVAEIAGRTRGNGPAVEDDLKKIHGVGPKLEKLLKSMDITSFRQVANFTTDDIRYVTAALDAFPGRIERDDWMASAAEEHRKKYSEPA